MLGTPLDVTNLLLDSPPLSEYVPSGECKQLHSYSLEIMFIRSFDYTYRQRHRFLQLALLIFLTLRVNGTIILH